MSKPRRYRNLSRPTNDVYVVGLDASDPASASRIARRALSYGIGLAALLGTVAAVVKLLGPLSNK